MSVLILVSNGAIQRSNRICSQDQHAQAQHWLWQAQLMHAQHWPRTQSRSRQGGGGPPLPCSHLVPRPMLSMHELSLPEPMLSLSMLILATCPEHTQKCSEHFSARSECSARSERSWALGTLFGYNTGAWRLQKAQAMPISCYMMGFLIADAVRFSI